MQGAEMQERTSRGKTVRKCLHCRVTSALSVFAALFFRRDAMAFSRWLHRNPHFSPPRSHRVPFPQALQLSRVSPLAISRTSSRTAIARRRDARTSLFLSRGALCLAAVHGKVISKGTEPSTELAPRRLHHSSPNSSRSLTVRKEESNAKVEFQIKFRTDYGQQLKIVGSASEFGSWAIAKCPAMKWSDGDVWSTTLRLPVGNIYEYKYVVVDSHGASVVHWQKGNNCVLAIGMTDKELVVGDNWEGSPGASVTSRGKGIATKEERLLDWAAEMKAQSSDHTEIVLETKQALEEAQEETRMARQDSTRLKSELRMASMTRQAAEQQVKELQQENRRLLTLLTEQHDVHKQILEQALAMLKEADDVDEQNAASALDDKGDDREVSATEPQQQQETRSGGAGSSVPGNGTSSSSSSSSNASKKRKPQRKATRRQQRKPHRSRASGQDAAVSTQE